MIFKLVWIGFWIWIWFIQDYALDKPIIARIFGFLLTGGFATRSLISKSSSGSFYDADDIGDDGGGE